MKKQNTIYILFIIIVSIILIYVTPLIGELVVSFSFMLIALSYLYIKRSKSNMLLVVFLLIEALVLLFSYQILYSFDRWLRNISNIDQVVSVDKGNFYKSILISIDKIDANNPINAAEIYISFDPKSTSILDIKTIDEFLKITLNSSFDNKTGQLYIAGGLPNPGIYKNKVLFAQLFYSQSPTSKSQFTISDKSRILANDGKGTQLSSIKGGPVFKLSEVSTTNTLTIEENANTRSVLETKTGANLFSTSEINTLVKWILLLNSKIIEK